jgi:hypothetical protein
MTHREHIHQWNPTSRHDTSEGQIVYQHCDCGSRRITTSLAVDRATVALVEADRYRTSPATTGTTVSSAYCEDRIELVE